QHEGFDTDFRGAYTADKPGVFHCGDVMYDNSLYFSQLSVNHSTICSDHHLVSDAFILCTIHRDNNTDEPGKLEDLFATLIRVAESTGKKVVLPLHPRTANVLARNLSPALYQKVQQGSAITLLPPVSFFDMIELERHCSLVMTDSGGVQKEAYFFKKPVIILRNETEWVEIVEAGAGRVCGTRQDEIMAAVEAFTLNPPQTFPEIFGDGKAAEFICRTML
ncbi:MAG: UDP-N-acetylglucosamine 2-epimerase (non-hydrolyzing), partial [Bacteroidetes bacterium HGW-Bacteroidetes-22]